MLTDRRGEYPHQTLRPCWPQEVFNTRRKFRREDENKPYIEWLQGRFVDGDEVNEEDDVDDDVDDSGEDEVDGRGDDEGNEAEVRADDEVAGLCNGRSIARLFMEGMTGDERLLQYDDQVDVVAGFFEQYRCWKSEKAVALLDDSKYVATSPAKRKKCTPNPEPLTSNQLREVLREQRFNIESDQTDPSSVVQEETQDVGRRLLFLTDLNKSTMEALMSTAPRSHAQALKDFFYKYVKGENSIGVTIPSQGFKIFTFDFHVSFFVLKESKELLQDTRRRRDGKPLRQSRALHFLSRPMGALPSTEGVPYLYEAQMSVTVTGIDHWIWTTYGIFETYFGSKDSIETCHQMKSRTGRADPLTAGQLPSNSLIRTPREYFAKVMEIRMNEIRRNWRLIVDKVKVDVKQKSSIFPLESIDSNTRQIEKDFSVWSTHMVKLLRILISSLSEAVSAWDKFQRREICYFLYDDDFRPTSGPLRSSLHSIEDVFEDLRSLLEKLRHLKKELCQDSPQGLNALYNRGNHKAQIFQQRSAFHIQVLTVITVLFLPPALAAAIFSTQGVLPFTPNLARFAEVLIILGILMVVSIVVLYKWQSLFQLIVDYIPRWPRNTEVPRPCDLEMGSGNRINNLE